MEEVKIFLFARWIETCYADEHLDNEMKFYKLKPMWSHNIVNIHDNPEYR
jgi:hypothetical protein